MARLLILCLLATGISLPAAAQGIDPTLLRAAYCVGVLKENITSFDSMAAGLLAQPRLRAEALATADQFRGKHRRYAEYLALHVLSTTGGSGDVLIGTVVAKGEHDAAAGLGPDGWTAHNQCRATHQAQADILSCLAATHETQANILRCLTLPDGLPF